MEAIASKPFEFERCRYEIRVVSDGERYKVAVFIGNQRANDYMYSADAIIVTHGIHAYEHLMGIAESDVREKYWEKYLAAVQLTRTAQ
jgi:hypothetical protein